jgi:8-oxo-dGTP diphosphatase
MESVGTWTGRTACALQSALRLTNEAFADLLGVAVRTVATWHQRPDMTPKAEMQHALDTALDRAAASAKTRFTGLMAAQDQPLLTTSDTAQALRVAIAVVVKDSEVLIVCRRGDDGGGISWQFPAGMIKPGVPAAAIAIRETLAETAVHCAVVRTIGSRLHPMTNVFCEYLLCEYLAGDAKNVDVVENVSVVWANKSKLTRFIPADRIFPPILEALEVPLDPA